MLHETIKRAQDYFHNRKFNDAKRLLNELYKSHPGDIQLLAMLAMANTRLEHIDDAISCYKMIISLKPGHAGALLHTGILYKKKNRPGEAKDYLLRAHCLDKDNPVTLKQLGDVSRSLNELDEAFKYYRRSLAVNPEFVQAHSALGQLYSSCGNISQAKDAYKAALQHNPAHIPSLARLGGLLLEQGDHVAAIALFKRALNINPAIKGARTLLLFSLNYCSTDRDLIFKAHKEWGQIHTPLSNNLVGHDNPPDPGRQLRIGYLSPDFCEHPVSFFLEPLLENHDKSQYQIYAYSNVETPDSTTTRLAGLVDTLRPVFGLSDSELAKLIRADKIDILVDLAGHTTRNRLPVFGLKPAPVQVTYLGYPNTTGVPAIDYRITDNVADPPGSTDNYYTEQMARLPGGFLCYRPPAQSPAVMSLPAAENGYITFGSFNNLTKITPEAIKTWSQILNAIPRSRLFIKCTSDTQTQARYIELFRIEGVKRHQLDFIGFVSGINQHLDMYNRIDISLDTFPYNGTTTTCESLWMGVPVIALAGHLHAGRVSMSILSQIGLDDFVATSLNDYVQIAIKYSADLEKLAALRKRLRELVRDSKLCDGNTFTQELEKLYRTIWNTWCISKTTSPGYVFSQHCQE